jgi:hypothetical protein
MKIVDVKVLVGLAAVLITYLPSTSATAQECMKWDGNVSGIPAGVCISVSQNGDVSGNYFYFRYRTPIRLSGNLDPIGKKLKLSEFGGSNHPQTATGM